MRRDRIRAVLELAVALAAFTALTGCAIALHSICYLAGRGFLQTHGYPEWWTHVVLAWAVTASALWTAWAALAGRDAIREFRGRG
jgi:hypothetical protein